MNQKYVYPTPWYVPAATANFGLMLLLFPALCWYQLIQSWATIQQKAAEQTPSLVFMMIGVTLGPLVIAFYFLWKAVRIRRIGLHTSWMAKSPRLHRILNWIIVIACIFMLITFAVQYRSPLIWIWLAYLLVTMLALGFAADFAARAALREVAVHPGI